MDKINYLIHYIKHQTKAVNEHGIHSPFVYNLYLQAIKNKLAYYCFEDIESIRAKLLLSQKTIEINDLGAGSKRLKSSQRKIADIAKYALQPPKYAQLLFRLVNYFKPQTILELGTSLGISTLYLASVNSNANVISVEGDVNTAKIAQINFNKLNINNITLINKPFDLFFQDDFSEINRLDFVFIDGNHRYQSTIDYFNNVKAKLHSKSIVIIDDIYWSKEMTQAWQQIKNDNDVSVSLDLFKLGIVTFKKKQKKEHFILKF